MRVETEGGFNKAQEHFDCKVSLVETGCFESHEDYEAWRDDMVSGMERLREIDLDEFDNFQADTLEALEKLEAQKDKVIAGLVEELEAKDGEFQKEREMLTKRIRKLEGQLSKEKTTKGGN